MGKLTPTQRTLREMRRRGRVCAIVEKFNPFAGPNGIRQDLFGFADILALDSSLGFVAVQSCGQAFSEHARKLREDRAEECLQWLQTGACGCGVQHASIELWGWRKVLAKRGGKARVWAPRVQVFGPGDFVDIPDILR